ncbi:hypothetical protein CLOSTMETH_00191 [[Clostridium] methylpentosum DSM 5476]|uniref:Uncharacterized protein n=1 Tax=[Clostridium] methylpentosum DSM 5476 TaxID=537013 RepID=C0E8P6_9FIRM|nr:hypothetical protein CLOSTMETH_00191 [[Clostridium] methylpentosum DSM 5476]
MIKTHKFFTPLFCRQLCICDSGQRSASAACRVICSAIFPGSVSRNAQKVCRRFIKMSSG